MYGSLLFNRRVTRRNPENSRLTTEGVKGLSRRLWRAKENDYTQRLSLPVERDTEWEHSTA